MTPELKEALAEQGTDPEQRQQLLKTWSDIWPEPDAWQPIFLAMMGDNGGVVGEAAKAVNRTRFDIYNEVKRERDFAKAFEEAKELGICALEDRARERAMWGGKGSDLLTIFLLKAARPNVYRDRHDHRHEVAHEVPAGATILDSIKGHLSHQRSN